VYLGLSARFCLFSSGHRRDSGWPVDPGAYSLTTSNPCFFRHILGQSLINEDPFPSFDKLVGHDRNDLILRKAGLIRLVLVFIKNLIWIVAWNGTVMWSMGKGDERRLSSLEMGVEEIG
jgi:hypothetical protein